MKKKIESFLVIAAFFLTPFFSFAEGKEKGSQCGADRGPSSQDLCICTSLCQDKKFCPYLEIDMGYRYDKINNISEFNTAYYDVLGSREQTLNFTELNFKGGFRFFEYLFLKGNVGLGFLGKDHDDESSYFKGTSLLLNAYTKDFHSGFAFDWLIGGGFHIPLYKNYVSIDPEIGYDYKKFKVDNSLTTRVSSPYAGGSLCFSPGWHVGITFYGSYFFSPGLEETGFLYMVKTNSFIPAPAMHTDHGITAYKVGANFSYLFSTNFSVNFNWERFSASADTVSGTIAQIGGNINFQQTLDFWRSNQFQLGVRYSF